MLWRNLQFPWTWTSGIAPPPVPNIPPGSLIYLDIPWTLIVNQITLPSESSSFPVPTKGIFLSYQVIYNNPSSNAVIRLEGALDSGKFSKMLDATSEGLFSIISGTRFLKVVLEDNPDEVAITVWAVFKRNDL